jgi:hypothetical protein
MATATRIPKKAPTSTIEPTENDIQESIRARAYQLFEQRGEELGHDVEDWLRAEAEILGNRKPTAA